MVSDSTDMSVYPNCLDKFLTSGFTFQQTVVEGFDVPVYEFLHETGHQLRFAIWPDKVYWAQWFQPFNNEWVPFKRHALEFTDAEVEKFKNFVDTYLRTIT